MDAQNIRYWSFKRPYLYFISTHSPSSRHSNCLPSAQHDCLSSRPDSRQSTSPSQIQLAETHLATDSWQSNRPGLHRGKSWTVLFFEWVAVDKDHMAMNIVMTVGTIIVRSKSSFFLLRQIWKFDISDCDLTFFQWIEIKISAVSRVNYIFAWLFKKILRFLFFFCESNRLQQYSTHHFRSFVGLSALLVSELAWFCYDDTDDEWFTANAANWQTEEIDLGVSVKRAGRLGINIVGIESLKGQRSRMK